MRFNVFSSWGQRLNIYVCNDLTPNFKERAVINGQNCNTVADNTARSATVCANYGGSDTCYWNDTIQICRCPDQGDPSYFYLYQLKSPPGCSLSYCVGERNVCNRGEYWNGFSCVSK